MNERRVVRRSAREATRAAWLAAACLAWAGCGRDGAGEAILASGFVEATEVRLSAETSGTVQRLPIEEGEPVSIGQVVAELDTTDAALAFRAALAERDQADAALRLAIAGARAEDIAEARAGVHQAEADLARATRDLERMTALVARGSAAEKLRDDAATARDVAGAQAEAARERLQRLQRGTRVEDIDAARARVAVAEARLALVGRDVEDATIESPRNGILTERLVEVGELVAPGTPLVLVTDLADAWLTAYVSETDLGRLRIGQEAEVLTDDGQRRTGRLSFIAPRAEFTPKNVQTRDERTKLVFKVRIDLENTDGLFKPGMPAEARLRSAAAPS